MKICGIYKITNTINNKCYIGQSIDCRKRINAHKHSLYYNKHTNSFLQNAYNLNKGKIRSLEVCHKRSELQLGKKRGPYAKKNK
jgi:hypothetical protein